MDFKVCGTTEGITALQMDNKAKGLSTEILAEALGQAKRGRAFILDAMLEKIPAPREELSEYAPRIITIKIPVDKIRDVIGTGGKVIRGIQEETGASIEVHEDGNVFIASVDTGGEAARKMVEDIVKVPEVGEEYEGEVVNIQSFGAFVKLTPGEQAQIGHNAEGGFYLAFILQRDGEPPGGGLLYRSNEHRLSVLGEVRGGDIHGGGSADMHGILSVSEKNGAKSEKRLLISADRLVIIKVSI